MRIKNSNLEWYILIYDPNKKVIKPYNVMTGIAEKISKEVKRKKICNKADLKSFLQKEFMYVYLARTEYEILVSDLISNTEPTKIDGYYQLQHNMDAIVEYVNVKCDLKF